VKSYNSIEYFGEHWGIPVIAFDKLDGSNLRFEWNKKRGFYKFGSRNVMIDENSEQFGVGVKIIKEKYEEQLSRIFTTKKYRDILSFVCYGEFIGKNSAFGQHDFANDQFDVVLFDIDRYKKGYIPPREFVDDFGELGIPRIVYTGNLNKEFVGRVKANEFNLSEGVICKGKINTKKDREQLYYCKIKTDDWFKRLRSFGDEKLIAEELRQSSKFST
jgi:hypothetical protein